MHRAGLLAVETVVQGGGWERHDGLGALIEHAVHAAAEEAGLDEDEAEVTVVLADDAVQRGLNVAWRSKDASTNVLSFPAAPMPCQGPRMLGDVVLAYETVAREAADEGRALEAHAAHLVVHGFLHLLGHDHENDTQAGTMEALETRVLKRLGFSDPYA